MAPDVHVKNAAPILDSTYGVKLHKAGPTLRAPHGRGRCDYGVGEVAALTLIEQTGQTLSILDD